MYTVRWRSQGNCKTQSYVTLGLSKRGTTDKRKPIQAITSKLLLMLPKGMSYDSKPTHVFPDRAPRPNSHSIIFCVQPHNQPILPPAFHCVLHPPLLLVRTCGKQCFPAAAVGYPDAVLFCPALLHDHAVPATHAIPPSNPLLNSSFTAPLSHPTHEALLPCDTIFALSDGQQGGQNGLLASPPRPPNA